MVSYYSLEDALTFLLPTPQESQSLRGLSVSEDVQNYHALSLRRQSLGTSNQDCTESLSVPPHNSSQASYACELPPDILAMGSGATNTEEWFDMLSSPIGNPTSPYQLHPQSHTCTTPRSGNDRQHIVTDDATASGWYNFK